MRGLTKFNPAFLAGVSTPPVSGGGSGANEYNFVFTPNGGAYMPGMEIVMTWDTLPAGTYDIYIQRQWKNSGDPDSTYELNTFYAYGIGLTSPQSIILQDHPTAVPGIDQRLRVGLLNSGATVLIDSATFIY